MNETGIPEEGQERVVSSSNSSASCHEAVSVFHSIQILGNTAAHFIIFLISGY